MHQLTHTVRRPHTIFSEPKQRATKETQTKNKNGRRGSTTMVHLKAALSICLLLLSHFALADQQQIDDENNDDMNQIEVCSDGVIQVQDIQIACDSPGTFYYGSGKYRNSATCMPGDKGQIRVDFYIAEPDIIASNGNYVLIDIKAAGGWMGQTTQIIYEGADLCSLSTLNSKGSTCPYGGYYYIKTHFYFEDSNGSSNVFYPKLTVGFKSSINKNVYDYGGANTNLCRGSTFITWSDRIAVSYANALGNFVKTFGILVLTMFCLVGFIWAVVKKPASFKEARQTFTDDISRTFSRRPKKDGLLEEEFDFSKMRKGKQSQDIVDF